MAVAQCHKLGPSAGVGMEVVTLVGAKHVKKIQEPNKRRETYPPYEAIIGVKTVNYLVGMLHDHNAFPVDNACHL